MPNPIVTVESRQTETRIPYEGIPFPKQDWHGLRTPKYTDLYLNYTEPVHCIRTFEPIGFYGYIDWVASCVILAETLVDMLKTREPSFLRAFSHLARAIFFAISFTRASKAYQECSREVQIAGGSFVVDGEKVTYAYNSFAFTFMAVPALTDVMILILQSLNIAVEKFLEKYTWLYFMMFIINLLAFLATLLFSFLFYTGYTLFLYADDSLSGQISCVVISLFLLVGSLLLYVKFKFHLSPWDVLGAPKLTLSVAAVVFHALCVGISYTLLGRTIDDPWGATSCTGPLGTLHAALDGVIRIVTTITSLLQS